MVQNNQESGYDIQYWVICLHSLLTFLARSAALIHLLNCTKWKIGCPTIRLFWSMVKCDANFVSKLVVMTTVLVREVTICFCKSNEAESIPADPIHISLVPTTPTCKPWKRFCSTSPCTAPKWVTIKACRIYWRRSWWRWGMKLTPSGASSVSWTTPSSSVLLVITTWRCNLIIWG